MEWFGKVPSGCMSKLCKWSLLFKLKGFPNDKLDIDKMIRFVFKKTET